MSFSPSRAFLAVIVLAAPCARADDYYAPPDASPPVLDLASYYTGDATESLTSARATSGSQTITDSISSCCDGPLWSVQAGALILARTSRSTPLVESLAGDPLVTARSLGTPWAAGPDLSVRRWLDSGNSLQFRFFDVDGFNSRATVATPPLFVLPTIPPLFGFGISDVTATYATRLYSTELNWISPAASWFSWLVGFRWVELYENLNEHFVAAPLAANLRFQTANRLYGGQAGALISLFSRGAVRIDSVLKAGLYGNAASNQFTATENIVFLISSDRSSQVAFLGEIGLVSVYQWTDHIALRGGYQLLWLDGIALAPDQVAATQLLARNGIDTKGDSFYHGALLGVEVAW